MHFDSIHTHYTTLFQKYRLQEYAYNVDFELKPIEICLIHKPTYLGCFLFYPKMCILFKNNAIFRLCLKNISPSKRMIGFILNNSHLSMMEDIVFYALYKSRVLIMPCKVDDSCLFIGLPDEIYKKAEGIVMQF